MERPPLFKEKGLQRRRSGASLSSSAIAAAAAGGGGQRGRTGPGADEGGNAGGSDQDLAASFGPETISTESTESVRTVKGGMTPAITTAAITTPSYPFPKMTNLGMGTPIKTPGAHKPFTTLSPTVTPNLAQIAKSRISQDFRESGHVPSRSQNSPEGLSSHVGFYERLGSHRPNNLQIAISVQTELGLTGWWSQVTQALKDSYGAERISLAVATDATDVENVPWAQLASYYGSEDDDFSRVTNDPQSSKSSMAGALSRHTTFSERSTDKAPASSTLRGLGFASSSSKSTSSRPRLESRHSYAGYPPRANNASSEGLAALAEASPPLPATSRQSSFRGNMHGEVTELKADLLRQHEIEATRSSLSDDFYSPAKSAAGRILQPVQPLESEADPLLTTAGVVRVLRREHATILTREYHDQSRELTEQKSHPGATQGNKLPSRQKGPSSTGPSGSPKLPKSQRLSKEASVASSTKSANQGKRRSSGNKTSGSASSEATGRKHTVMPPTAYEDFEQFPGTPWAQSPAPSPAPQAEVEDNPFFSSLPDQSAFDECPPEYEYGDPSQIPAIGLDRSHSIIQLPLIHPSATVSQVQRHHPSHPEAKARTKTRHDNRIDQERPGRASPMERQHTKRIPIAILSILAPTVPYPPDLCDFLNELAPMLATSFYAARLHTHMLLELSALSSRRPSPGSRLNLHAEQSMSNIAVATGLTFVDPARGRSFSPTSPSSTASASTQSTAGPHSPKGSIGGGSANATPGWEGHDSSLRVQNAAARSPAGRSPSSQEPRDDYFQTHTRQRHKDENTPQPSSHRPSAPVRTPSISKKNVMHSQGASFANTQPSLPIATSAYAMDEASETLNVPQDIAHVFKEPSSSILRTMIDNGATQQFIAESETGNLVWANSKFLAYRNTSKENIHEQLWKNIYYKDLNRFRKEWNRSLETGEQLSYQVRLKRFDGQHRWFHIRFLPLKDKYGLTKYWHGQAMDIHELHEAEVKAAKSKEKAASEARYRAIANSLPVTVFAASVPTGMTFANTQWLSYSGQTMEEALGFGFLEHVHPEDLVKCRFPGVDMLSPIKSHMRSNPLVRTESSVSSAGGESEGTGITDSTVKASPERQFNIEPSDDVLIPNELLRGLAQDGIIMCAKNDQGNLSIDTEMRLKNRRGEYRWHLVQGSYIESVNFGQGEAQWFIACTDISNQKDNEAKIQHANEALEEANSDLEKEMHRRMGYLSSMSHEIRTPLNGIIGNLQLLINSGLNETNGEWAHSAQESAKNMHELINDILDLSKAEANMLQLSYSWFNPREIMEQVMDMLSSRASEKRIEFVCECAETVPKVIRGDPGRVRQVLLNLVGNSIKFTDYGEVVVSCEMLPRLPPAAELLPLAGNEILVNWSVSDTGSGFTEDDKKLLFKPYSQIRNRSTRDTGGTGLGLILCKTMVDLHGGLIDATSKPGRGSTFTFFARFKARKGSTTSMKSGLASPTTASPAGAGISPAIDENTKDAVSRKVTFPPVDAMRESPALLSDSSSARSVASTAFRGSVRSSVSTTDSTGSMSLSLPPLDATSSTAEQAKRQSVPTSPRAPSSGNVLQKFLPKIKSPTASAPVITKTSPVSPHISNPAQTASVDTERTKFRPPMLSVLVICPAENTRRITCDQIRFVAPKSAPCNITSEARVDAAERLMHGNDPVTFTHVVFRVASDELLTRAVKHLLASPMHTKTCIVLITDQGQLSSLKNGLPEINFDKMNEKDRVKSVLKPAHVYKLARVFDPYNENFQITVDPKEAKRNEEKRLQKESYALFKKHLGGKGLRVMAVEDNSVQMNILCNFLQKMCHLDVVQAWNGQECFDLVTSHDAGYYSVIVSDIEMPVLDGLTMCKRLREWEEEHDRPPANVVSLSANTFHEGWVQSSKAGFTHYCPKPVNFRDLGHVVLELTDPKIPHKYLRDREMPRAMLKKLGLLPRGEGGSSDDDSD